MIKTLVTILLIFSLQGCALWDYFRKKDPVVVPPAKVVNIAPDALKECNMLAEYITIATFNDVMIAYGNLANEYGTCAAKQKTSVKLLKEFANIKE